MGIRVTQSPVEALALPEDADIRATQLSVEALEALDTANIRITQRAVEVLIKQGAETVSMVIV